MYCCTGYYLTEYGCQECIGSFALNCSLPCLSGYFGPRCTLHCQCVKDKCDAKFGCPKAIETISKVVEGTAASEKGFPEITKEVSCCTGYYMYEENMTCLACIGAWGQNCSIPCSSGFYGRLCKSRCLCPENQCDKLTGCVKESGDQFEADVDRLITHILFHWILSVITNI
uniref:Tyrosine-protein kinase receptor Tie-2 n=1 Tax=Magallana gigas TaxID=29159 RepID=K1PRY1_MAGGI